MKRTVFFALLITVTACNRNTGINEGDTPNINVLPKTATITSTDMLTIIPNVSSRAGMTKVEYFQNGTKFWETTGMPFSADVSYPAGTKGSYTIRVVAYAGSSTAEESIVLNVNVPTAEGDTIPPVINLFDASRTTVTDMQFPTIFYNATDNTGVSKVELFDNGTSFFESSRNFGNTPTLYTNADNGTHIIKMVATDGAGNKAESSLTVTVALP